MKKITITCMVAAATLLTQCAKSTDADFLISATGFGKLTKENLASDIETIYATDSIVKDNAVQLSASMRKEHIYEKGGKPLFTVSISNDSIIDNIRVLDPRYTTDKGVNLLSTFKDIKDNYTISKVLTSMNNVVLFIKDSDVYFTIDKKELPENLRYSNSTKIEAIQIPDAAKIKYLMIDWE